MSGKSYEKTNWFIYAPERWSFILMQEKYFLEAFVIAMNISFLHTVPCCSVEGA
jgi:hypothetical protein